jgi:hypothetical protein
MSGNVASDNFATLIWILNNIVNLKLHVMSINLLIEKILHSEKDFSIVQQLEPFLPYRVIFPKRVIPPFNSCQLDHASLVTVPS